MFYKMTQLWPTDVIFKSLNIFVLEFNIGRNMTKMRRNPNEPNHRLFLLVLTTLAPFRVFTKVAPTSFVLLFSFLFLFFFFSLFSFFLLCFWVALSGLHLRTMKHLNHDRLRHVSWRLPASAKCTSLVRLSEGIMDITCQLISKLPNRNTTSDESQDFGLL